MFGVNVVTTDCDVVHGFTKVQRIINKIMSIPKIKAYLDVVRKV